MSPDTWRLIAYLLRSLLFNWLALLPLMFAAVLLAQTFFFVDSDTGRAFLCDWGQNDPSCVASVQTRIHFLMIPIGMVLFSYATLIVLWLIESAASVPLAGFAVVVALAGLGWILSATQTGSPASLGTSLLLVTASVATLTFYTIANHVLREGTTGADRRNWLTLQQARILKSAALIAFFLLVVGFSHDIYGFLFSTGDGLLAKSLKRAGGWGGLALTVISAVYTAVTKAPSTRGEADRRPSLVGKILIAVAPPLVVIVLLVLFANLAHQLLASTAATKGSLVHALCVAALGFALVELVFALYEGMQGLLLAAIGGGWNWFALLSPKRLALPLAAWGLLTLFRKLVPNGSLHAYSSLISSMPLSLGALLMLVVLPAVYLLSPVWPALSRLRTTVLLCIAAATSGLTLILGQGSSVLPGATVALLMPLLWIAILVGAVIALGWLTDPNLISLHAFYKARLTRAYLGASNTDREYDDITDAVPGDDIPLTSLWNHDAGGPYLLVNAARNLVGGSDLASAQRLAENFIMSRYHCGSARAGYRCTHDYMRGELSLATAVAISGAAVSPTMGSKSPSAALTLLLSLLNVRLGFWAPTPSRERWYEPHARLWPFYVLKETLANTGKLSTYSYLTDGGHFDNTGLYALIERACRFIVICDCGADPKLGFEDIGNAIRRCRIDFGVEIDLTIDQFVKAAKRPGIGPTHIVRGTISYQSEHLRMLGLDPAGPKTGKIVWVKPTVTGLCAADVHQYHRAHDDFPQQPTADQWYDESQFESYRRLGFESAQQLWTDPAPGGTPLVKGDFGSIPGWFGP